MLRHLCVPYFRRLYLMIINSDLYFRNLLLPTCFGNSLIAMSTAKLMLIAGELKRNQQRVPVQNYY